MKNMLDDKFTEELANRMRGIREEPKDLVWEHLSARLEKDRNRAIWWDYTGKGMFLVALLATMLIVSVNTKNFEAGDRRKEHLSAGKAKVEPKTQSPVATQQESESNAVERNKEQHHSEPEFLATDGSLTKHSSASASDFASGNGKAGIESKDDQSYVSEFFAPYFLLPDRAFPMPELQLEGRIPALIVRKPQHGSMRKEEGKKRAVRRMTSYLQVTPLVNYITMDPTDKDDVEITGMESTGIFSSNRLGYSIGAGLTRDLTDRLSVAAGFHYYQQRMQVRYSQRVMGQFQVEREGDEITLIPVYTEESKTIDHSMKNVGADINVFYSVRKLRLEQKAGAGLSFQYGLRRGKASDHYVNEGSWYLHYNILYQLEFTLNERMSVYFQPRYSRPLVTDEKLIEPMKLKTSRAAASLGFTFRF